jgi:hypothetical protein
MPSWCAPRLKRTGSMGVEQVVARQPASRPVAGPQLYAPGRWEHSDVPPRPDVSVVDVARVVRHPMRGSARAACGLPTSELPVDEMQRGPDPAVEQRIFGRVASDPICEPGRQGAWSQDRTG